MEKKGFLTFMIGAAAGILIIVFICHQVGTEKIWNQISTVGPLAFIAFFFNYSIAMLLQGKGWQIILKANGYEIKFKDIFYATCMGQAGNFLTPSAYIGGEPIRAVYISRKYGIRKRLVFASVFIAKFQEFTCFLLAIIIGSIEVYIHYFKMLPLGVKILLLIFNIFILLSFILLQYSIMKGKQILRPALKKIAYLGLSPRKLTRAAFYVGESEKWIHKLYVANPKSTIKSFFLILFSMFFIFTKPMFFFIFLNNKIPFNFPELSLIFVLTQIVLALQFTPGGFGILEGGQIGTYAIVGYDPPSAMAYLASMRLSDITYVSLGIFLITNYGLTFLLTKNKKEKSI
ncbi:MAG: flippase-like domain-containing protein [Candidatus Coatesbacteria bacterium]|nr:flippase-like domain-containing protein [Candidatus Coatesbacteria bacterium]